MFLTSYIFILNSFLIQFSVEFNYCNAKKVINLIFVENNYILIKTIKKTIKFMKREQVQKDKNNLKIKSYTL